MPDTKFRKKPWLWQPSWNDNNSTKQLISCRWKKLWTLRRYPHLITSVYRWMRWITFSGSLSHSLCAQNLKGDLTWSLSQDSCSRHFTEGRQSQTLTVNALLHDQIMLAFKSWCRVSHCFILHSLWVLALRACQLGHSVAACFLQMSRLLTSSRLLCITKLTSHRLQP